MEKTAFYLGAEAAMEKVAEGQMGKALRGLTLANVVGAGLGHRFGARQKERGEKYNFGTGQGLAALFVPGGLGYQVGRAWSHSAPNKKK